MKELLTSLLVLLCFSPAVTGAQLNSPQDVVSLFALLRNNRKAFAERLTSEGANDFEKVHTLVAWLAQNLERKATDYQQRTVQQIIERKGGNCNELAQVTVALLKELGMPMRRVREINIHRESDRRQETAAKMVAEQGNQMSVFGRQHNDHVWIEVYDRVQKKWFPADPSLGVVGEEEWLRARLGFGPRKTLDPTSEDMIAPFAIFVFQPGSEPIDRTQHYVIDGFDRIYHGDLHQLPAWSDWTRLVKFLSQHALAAFQGESNLHEQNDKIAELAKVYQKLKAQESAKLKWIHKLDKAFSQNASVATRLQPKVEPGFCKPR